MKNIKRFYLFLIKDKTIKGFSLIELLVVIAILGVLVAVAIPSYKRHQDNAKRVHLSLYIKAMGEAYLYCSSDIDKNCNTITDIKSSRISDQNIDCPENVVCNDPKTGTKGFCFDAYKGDSKACFSTEGSAQPIVLNSWTKPLCHTLYTKASCANGKWDFDSVSSNHCNGFSACVNGPKPTRLTANNSKCPDVTTQYVPCEGGSDCPVSPCEDSQKICPSSTPNCQVSAKVCPKSLDCSASQTGMGVCQTSGLCH